MTLIRNHSLITGNYHPFYKAVLSKATSLGYKLPSKICQGLQDRMVKQLTGSVGGFAFRNYWSRISWLYVMANDTNESPFGLINFVTPSEVGSGSPTVVNKKGWQGNASFNHAVHTDAKFIAGNCWMGFYSTVGGAVSAVENIFVQNDGTNYVTMRHRTNPRIDYLMNGTIAAVQAFPTVAAANNTTYIVDNDNAITDTVYHYRNGVSVGTTPGGVGIRPSSGALGMSSITSPRVTGMIFGGSGMATNFGVPSVNADLNTIFQQYMTAVQAL